LNVFERTAYKFRIYPDAQQDWLFHNTRNMTASAKGTVAEPGMNVAQKAGLNRVVLDVSPGKTRIQFAYMMKRQGGRIVIVNPAYTWQQCSCCQHRQSGSRPDRDTFCCLSCGHEDCADLNAANNIRRKGLEALVAQTGGHPGLACGSNSAGSRKQERDGREAASPVLQGGE